MRSKCWIKWRRKIELSPSQRDRVISLIFISLFMALHALHHIRSFNNWFLWSWEFHLVFSVESFHVLCETVGKKGMKFNRMISEFKLNPQSAPRYMYVLFIYVCGLNICHLPFESSHVYDISCDEYGIKSVPMEINIW